MTDDAGDVRTKNVTVSPIDLRLGRICLSRTDITDSIREQQRLLRVVAYTCELACFIDTATGGLVMYTRQMVLENLPPSYCKKLYCSFGQHNRLLRDGDGPRSGKIYSALKH